MASEIGWVDISPVHRNRIRKFLEMMGAGGIVDELGVGVIRDEMSARLFPGFSTLYTRAKYFFITPYILWEKDSKKKPSQSDQEYLRSREEEINRLINDYYLEHDNSQSYFGKDRANGKLKRQPSEVYWNGMATLHLMDSEKSLDQILKDKKSTIEELLANNNDNENSTKERATKEKGEVKGKSEIGVEYDKDWIKNIEKSGLRLTEIEAQTLCDRLERYAPNSLPTALARNKSLWKNYKEADDFVSFVGENIDAITNDILKTNLKLAHDMALVIHLAHLAYNISIWSRKAESLSTDDEGKTIDAIKEFVELQRTKARSLKDELNSRLLDKSFKISSCMEGANVKTVTKDFLQRLEDLALSPNEWDAIESEMIHLVEKQERWNKKSKSRFAKLESGKVVDVLNGRVQWLGLGLMPYRFYSTKQVFRDIYEVIGE